MLQDTDFEQDEHLQISTLRQQEHVNELNVTAEKLNFLTINNHK